MESILTGQLIRYHAYGSPSSVTGEPRCSITVALETNSRGANDAERREFIDVNMDVATFTAGELDNEYEDPIEWEDNSMSIGDIITVRAGIPSIKMFTKNDGTPSAQIVYNGHWCGLRYKAQKNMTEGELEMSEARKAAHAKAAGKARAPLAAKGKGAAAVSAPPKAVAKGKAAARVPLAAKGKATPKAAPKAAVTPKAVKGNAKAATKAAPKGKRPF